jgi:hypothetical protein
MTLAYPRLPIWVNVAIWRYYPNFRRDSVEQTMTHLELLQVVLKVLDCIRYVCI